MHSRKILVIGALALLVAGCGGGGGGDTVTAAAATPPAPAPAPAPPPAPTPSLQLSGTAATGAALANAVVEAKCATGTASGNTGANGSYSLTLQGGQLPCIVQMRSAGITLHSVADAGTTNAATAVTSATAHLTPVSELLVARLTVNVPVVTYAVFDTALTGLLTPSRVSAAIAEIAAALKANGVDLAGIDPLKGALEAANGTTPGNAHDKLLELLATRIHVRALPQVVNQVALAAAANSASGVANAIDAISGGSLPGCPTALSGSYRTLEYRGKMATRTVDFKAMKFQAGNGTDWFDIVVDPSQPCAFIASGVSEGRPAEFSVVMGDSGAGVYRTRFTNPATPGAIGYVFPAQAHGLDVLQGPWTVLRSGYSPESAGTLNYAQKFEADAAALKVTPCFYDPAHAWACLPLDPYAVGARTDGGFDLKPPALSSPAFVLYGYRAPSGTMTLFGSSNPAGNTSDPGISQMHLVAAKLGTLTLPAVDSGLVYSEAAQLHVNGVPSSTPPTAIAYTFVAVDTAASTVRRRRVSDGREDTIVFNQPLAGWRTRPAGNFNGVRYDLAYGVTLPGTGLVTSLIGEPGTQPPTVGYTISVVR